VAAAAAAAVDADMLLPLAHFACITIAKTLSNGTKCDFYYVFCT